MLGYPLDGIEAEEGFNLLFKQTRGPLISYPRPKWVH